MNVHFPARRRTWPSLLVNIVVVVVVVALAADAFVLSYSGVHAIVVQAGVSTRLARFYPALFDAVFVIACVAAVMMRGARWWALWYAWLVIILMVAVVGAADAVHAMNVALPHRTIEGVVAAAPWVLVLLGFGLMLTMLRQSRAQHAPAAALAEPAPAYQAPGPAELPEAASAQETRALPVGVWEPLAEQEPEGVPAPEAAMPQEEATESAEPTVAAYVDAPEPDTTDLPAAPEADADAGTAATDEDTAGDTGPVERVDEEEPVMAAAADEAPEPAPEPAMEPVAAGNVESAAARQEDAAPTTPYNYWDSGADGGFNAPDRVPTLSGEVIDDDAPPFATAPFAAVPRLNRVRSTPTPPEEDEEESDPDSIIGGT
jgi:hypothetical protein